MFHAKRTYLLLGVLFAMLLFGLACDMSGGATPTPAGNAGDSAEPTEIGDATDDAQPTTPAAGSIDEPIIHRGVERVSDEGFVEIAGAVENTTGKWIGGIIVFIKLYDKDGNELSAVSTTGETEQAVVASNDVIPPGETAYFLFLRDTQNIEGEFHHSKLAVQYREVEPEYRATGKISNLNVGDLNEIAIDISGLFTNASDVTCLEPTVVTVGFNADGLVYEVQGNLLEDEAGEILAALAPGKKAQFTASLYNPDNAIANVKVIASCASRE